MRAGTAGGIEAVLKAIDAHMDRVDLCRQGCAVLYSLTINNCKNNMIVVVANLKVDKNIINVEERVIETLMRVINTHVDNVEMCSYGCWILANISEANIIIQKKVCEKGGVQAFLRILKVYASYLGVCEDCCSALGIILSSPETHSEYCTSEVIRVVEECYEKHNDSDQIKQFFHSLKREEDLRVCEAIALGSCTKSLQDYAQQKGFKCLTCDKGKDKIKVYCEVCWKRNHWGHNVEEFFYPIICDT